MNAIATWLLGVSILFVVALAVDAILARRHPLTASALWNAVLAVAIALPAAAWWMPRWELPLLPAAQPPVRTAGNLEWVQVDHAGNVVAVPPPPMVPRQEAGPHALPVPSRPATAFDPLPVESKPRWPNWRVDLGTSLAVLYTGGLIVLLLQLTANLWAVRRLRRRAQPVASPLWLTRFEVWRRTITPWRAVALLKSDAVSVPIVLGSWRPAVVISSELAEERDASLIDAILVHELAHVERADCFWQLVERLVQAFYWFHPLIWLASRRIAAVRERACDDYAIHALADREAYVETLLEMATRLSRRQRLGLAMAVVRTTKLERRLAAIERSEGQPRVRMGGVLRGAMTIALLAIVAISFGVRLVRAEAEPTPPSKSVSPPGGKSAAGPPPGAPRPAAPGEAASEVDALFAERDKAEPAAAQAIDEDDIDFVRDAFPQQQKELVTEFHDLLAAGQFDEAEKLFAPALQKQFSAANLKELVITLTRQFSPLESRLVLSSKRAGTQELLEVQSAWGRHRLSITFHFNKRNQIDGLWFSLDPRYKQFAPELTRIKLSLGTLDLTADALVLGPELAQLASENKSLTVRFVDDKGSAADGRHIIFYRALEPDEPARQDDWRDTITGMTWRSITSESRVEGRAARLTPGNYRAMLSWSDKYGHQLSDPIVIDDDQQDVAVDVPVRPTGTLTVRAVDATTGDPLPGCSVSLVADDPKLPSYTISGNYEESEATIKGLIPGRHRLTVNFGAKRLGELDYEQSEQLVDVFAGDNAPITVRMQGKAIAPADKERRWPYFASGRVTDGHGRPIKGAQVSALIVYGNEREGGHVTSDADGRYRLQFGSGNAHAPHIEFPATIQINKPGFYDRDLLTRKQLVLLNQDCLPESSSENVAYLMPGQTLELDFTLLPGIDLKTEFVDAAGKPIDDEAMSLLARLPGGPRHAAGGKTSPAGELAVEGISPQDSYVWARIGNGVFLARSRPFRFATPGNYRMRVQSESERADPTPSTRLAILQVLDGAGEDVTAEVVGDDPLLRDPLPAELQTACQEIVDKLLAANQLWLEPPPKDLRYSFEIKFDEIGKNRRMSFELPAPDATNLLARHGVTYASPLMKLGEHKNVVYRALEVTPDKAVLAYTFEKPVRIMVGNGVDDHWRGSIQSYSREGILVIDTARNVPLELQGDMLVERFDDYREVSSGQYVPLRIRISSSDEWIWRDTRMNFEWEFLVYEPNLWMFHRARDPQAPERTPIMTLENLLIDSQPARRLDNWNDRRIVEPPPKR